VLTRVGDERERPDFPGQHRRRVPVTRAAAASGLCAGRRRGWEQLGARQQQGGPGLNRGADPQGFLGAHAQGAGWRRRLRPLLMGLVGPGCRAGAGAGGSSPRARPKPLG
jgi:hypothetical protein